MDTTTELTTQTFTLREETVGTFGQQEALRVLLRYLYHNDEAPDDLSVADTLAVFVTHGSHWHDQLDETELARYTLDHLYRVQEDAAYAYAETVLTHVRQPGICPNCLTRMYWRSDWGDYDCGGSY